eukprot:2804337-Rhodomonas_salina.2
MPLRTHKDVELSCYEESGGLMHGEATVCCDENVVGHPRSPARSGTQLDRGGSSCLTCWNWPGTRWLTDLGPAGYALPGVLKLHADIDGGLFVAPSGVLHGVLTTASTSLHRVSDLDSGTDLGLVTCASSRLLHGVLSKSLDLMVLASSVAGRRRNSMRMAAEYGRD